MYRSYRIPIISDRLLVVYSTVRFLPFSLKELIKFFQNTGLCPKMRLMYRECFKVLILLEIEFYTR